MIGVHSWFMDKLASIWGYDGAVFIDDLIILFSGIVIGILIMSILSSRFLYRIDKVSKDGDKKVKLVRISDKGFKSSYIVNFGSFSETLEEVLLLCFSPFFTKKSYTLKDKKRTERFLIIMFIIFLLTLSMSFISIIGIYK